MKKSKRFRKIEWAMANTRGRKKGKLKKLFGKMAELALSVFLKFSVSMNTKKTGRVSSKQGKTSGTSNDTHESIELTQISGTKSKSTNYYDDEGYLYTKYNKYKSHVYLKCKNSTANDCHARVIWKNNEAVLVHGHNHWPEKKLVDKTIFDKTLQQICEDNPTLSPLLCYKEAKHKLKGQIERKHIPMVSSYFSLIYRSQKLKIPLLPKTIAEFELLINEAKNHQRFAYDDAGHLLYRGIWRGTSGDNLAFVSERTLQEISKHNDVTLLMDGTFKAVPKHLNFQQLYIINVIIRDNCFPLAYVLMERKDFASYMVVFDEIKKLLPSMNVKECMSDYEAATRKAILIQFPGARLSGCFFHYVQAIMKACRRFGLLKYDDSDRFKMAVNKVAALALLPNQFITEGFEIICKEVTNSQRWNRFKSYWLNQWNAANISVYGLKHRTNNFSETLNRTVNKLIGTKYPNVWKLTLHLQDIEMLKSDELEQVVGGAMKHRRHKKETKRLNKKIKRATRKFEKNQSVEIFLQNITFNDELLKIYNRRESNHDDPNGYDDEIIPNNYNEQTEFRKKHPRKAAEKRKKSGGSNIHNPNKKPKK